MIICISGLPGSGKTTLADILINKLTSLNYEVYHYNTDIIARCLFDGNIDQNIDYSDDELKVIYNSLFFLISEVQKANPNCIIVTDGMFRNTSMRLYLKMIADELNTRFILIKMDTSSEIAKKRLIERMKKGGLGGWNHKNNYEKPNFEEVININNMSDINKLMMQSIEILKSLNLDNNQPL